MYQYVAKFYLDLKYSDLSFSATISSPSTISTASTAFIVSTLCAACCLAASAANATCSRFFCACLAFLRRRASLLLPLASPLNASPSPHQARRILVFREGETTSGSTKAPLLAASRKKIVKEVKVRAILRSKYNFREKKPGKSSLVCWSQQGPGLWHSLLTLLEKRNQARRRDWKHLTMKRWAKTMRMGTAASDL